jgi:hypothetical protein
MSRFQEWSHSSQARYPRAEGIVVQPYRPATGCEAMWPRGCMMEMGLSHGSKDTIRFPPKLQKSSSERSSYALLIQPLLCEAVGGVYSIRSCAGPNIVEQDHRHIKRLVRPGLGFKSFVTASRTIAGYEAMAMIRKDQVAIAPANAVKAQRDFIAVSSAPLPILRSPLALA